MFNILIECSYIACCNMGIVKAKTFIFIKRKKNVGGLLELGSM